MTSAFRCLKAVPLAAALAWAAGCGGGQGYRVSGKVTFDGQPVPMGKIYFDPDTAAGGSGLSGFAVIVDGTFDTSATGGQGVAGGPTVVRIQGHKKEPADAISGYGPPLFVEHTVKADLQQGTSTKDFDVPASAAKGLPKDTAPLDPVPGQVRQPKGGT
jgi:hypothetical protein